MVTYKKNLETRLRAMIMAAATIALPSIGFAGQSHVERGFFYLEESKKPRLTTDDRVKLYNDSNREFSQALAENKDDCGALTGLGSIDVLARLPNKALPVLEKAAGAGCGEKALEMLGYAYIDLGRFDDAEKCTMTILSNNKNSAEAYKQLGFLFFVKKDYAKSIEFGKKALKLKPKFYQVMNNIGSAHMGLREFETAKKFSLNALKINPDYPNAYFLLGKAYKELGDKSKAKAAFEKAIELNPDAGNYRAELNSL